MVDVILMNIQTCGVVIIISKETMAVNFGCATPNKPCFVARFE
jgi:hypothetical protein